MDEDSPILDEHTFRRELESEMARAKRGRRRLSVLVGQLGSPGRYDFGQGGGDPLLERAGRALVEQKRQVDVLASLGRGRFVLILPETGEPGARVIAQRLRGAVAGIFREQSERPSIGFGVASFGRHGRTGSALLRAAQRAALAAQELDQGGPPGERHEIAAVSGFGAGRSSEADSRVA
jgi:diguanylate cyclase (GGDEF)-like protein